MADFPDAQFDRIIHDPPTFALAGELYRFGHTLTPDWRSVPRLYQQLDLW